MPLKANDQPLSVEEIGLQRATIVDLFSSQRWLVTYDAYRGELAEVRAALRALLKLLDDGILVRDTSHDSEDGWVMRQLPLLQALQMAAKIALPIAGPVEGYKGD